MLESKKYRNDQQLQFIEPIQSFCMIYNVVCGLPVSGNVFSNYIADIFPSSDIFYEKNIVT